MKIRTSKALVLLTALFANFASTDAIEQVCCDTTSASNRDAGAEAAACCADPTTAKAAVGPWIPGTLRNAWDPISAEATTSEYFLDYADADAGVFGRIYFASKESLDEAKTVERRTLYEKAFVVDEDGTFATYGKTRGALNNAFCPVSGVGNRGERKLVVDEALAVNCAAGACSLGDGFKANFNAMEIGTCCPSCIKMLAAHPDKFLINLEPEIDAATASKESDQ